MKEPLWSGILTGTLICLLGLVVVSRATAQDLPTTNQGENIIYNVNNSNSVTNSVAFVDASAFYTGSTGPDICNIINTILTSSSEFKCGNHDPKGVTIDARGIIPPALTTLSCSQSPFVGSSNCPNGVDGDMLSSTILLPAATIQIAKKWQLPANTRLVGEGQGLTVIQAKGSFGDVNMVEMGTPTVGCMTDCQGNGIEHLTIDGNSQSVNGIFNVNSQELSYVNDVALSGITGAGIGLTIAGSTAVNSGPYSNINFSGTGTCAKINGTYDIRGLHGLTCTATAASIAAVLLDGSNTSIEDVYINGPYTDGILVGANSTAQGDILFNIRGGSQVTNLVHICGPGSTPPCPSNQVVDLTLLGITSSANKTIRDDITQTTVTDANVGMYVLGEPISAGNSTLGNSRFTTSTSVPTWLVGIGTPSSPCAAGSLYSNTTGTAGATLWTCVNDGSGGTTWKQVK